MKKKKGKRGGGGGETQCEERKAIEIREEKRTLG